jgi:hypothetical protein
MATPSEISGYSPVWLGHLGEGVDLTQKDKFISSPLASRRGVEVF